MRGIWELRGKAAGSAGGVASLRFYLMKFEAFGRTSLDRAHGARSKALWSRP